MRAIETRHKFGTGDGACLLLGITALALCNALAARASAGSYDYTFTYSDGAGDKGFGTLVASTPDGWSPNDDGQLAVSGLFQLTGSSNLAALPPGSYPLVPTPGGMVATSGTGQFFVDSLVFPANDAGSATNNTNIGNPSYLTNDGLVFGTSGTFEINIWGNGGAHNYQLDVGLPSGITVSQAPGTFTLQLVPEPSSMILAGVAGVVAVGCGLRRRRQA